jgi:hypothetical protein
MPFTTALSVRASSWGVAGAIDTAFNVGVEGAVHVIKRFSPCGGPKYI